MHLVGTFTVLPKLFVTSGQEVARVVFRQFLIWQEEGSLLYSLIIMTHLDPLDRLYDNGSTTSLVILSLSLKWETSGARTSPDSDMSVEQTFTGGLWICCV